MLNSHLCLVAAILDSADLKSKFPGNPRNTACLVQIVTAALRTVSVTESALNGYFWMNECTNEWLYLFILYTDMPPK